MDAFVEIIKIILPACITGLVTFLVTKYNYHRNVPLDKMEITYNRLYYPLYRLVQKDMEIPKLIEESETYLKKYKKYMDRSTQVAFTFLKENTKSKKAYANFKNNIIDLNIRLRRRLGYLEPNALNMYTYSAPREKRVFRLVFEVTAMYLTTLILSFSIENQYINLIVTTIFALSFIIFIIEMIIVICQLVAQYFLKCYGKIREKLKK